MLDVLRARATARSTSVRDGDLRRDRRADRLPRRQLLHPAARARRSARRRRSGSRRAPAAPPTTAMGWEVDAGRPARPAAAPAPRLRRRSPIYITENGAGVRRRAGRRRLVEDPQRVGVPARPPRRAGARAVADGVDVRALLRVVAARQLRVGARLRQALRDRPRRLRDAAARRRSAARSGTATSSGGCAGCGAERATTSPRRSGISRRLGRAPQGCAQRGWGYAPSRAVRRGLANGCGERSGHRRRGGQRGARVTSSPRMPGIPRRVGRRFRRFAP